jgi:hypothetical protein
MSITLDGSNLATVGVINVGTAVASTSGTSINFTGIPSGTKRITVMFGGVSTSGTSEYIIQIGTSSGIQTSGYSGAASYVGGAPGTVNMSTGFTIRSDDSAEVHHGMATLCLLNSSTGLWVMNSTLGHSNELYTTLSGGSKTLSGTLDRVRITTVNGTDTFDAGSINILYE